MDTYTYNFITLTLDLHIVYMAINIYTHNTGVYNEDTKIWQLSDKIMQVVGGDSCSILMSASTTQETIFPPAKKCSQMVSYSL
jgi:hypothetical protein